MEILKNTAESIGTAVVIVTHNSEFSKIAHKVIHLHDGKISSVEINEQPVDIKEVQY